MKYDFNMYINPVLPHAHANNPRTSHGTVGTDLDNSKEEPTLPKHKGDFTQVHERPNPSIKETLPKYRATRNIC